MHLQANFALDVLYAGATTTEEDGPIGIGGDASATGPEALRFGAGAIAGGSGEKWTVTTVPTASAIMGASSAGAGGRVCTLQVAPVVRYVSAKGRHNARRREQGDVY